MEHKLSVVIPIYNEIETLEEIIRQVRAVDVGMDMELVLVDDYSTDGTRKLLEQIEQSGDETIRGVLPRFEPGKGCRPENRFPACDG